MAISRYKKALEDRKSITVLMPFKEVETIDALGEGRFRSRVEYLRHLILLGIEAEKKALEARESNSNASTTTI